MNYYLGIDVSKGYADFTMLNEKFETMEENFQLDDNFEGHALLHEFLMKFILEHDVDTIVAGVESTGGLENNWHTMLYQFQNSLPVKVTRINPIGINNASKASMNRNITDAISAQNIAEFMIRFPERLDFEENNKMSEMKRAWSLVRLLKKQKTQLLNHLQAALYSANPEILVYWNSPLPQWILTLIKMYPTAKKLAHAKVEKISAIPFVSTERAEKLIADAKRSVASYTDRTAEEMVKITVTHILALDKTIKNTVKKMHAEFDSPELKLLQSIPGIGELASVGLLIELGQIERFLNSKKLASYFGLHPVFKVSGDGKGSFRMSKKGRKEPRRILFMAVFTAIQHNDYLKEYYQAQLDNGMAKMSAIGKVMHKLIRIVFGVLKNKQPFNAEIDRNNINKKPAKKSVFSKKENKSRRFQKLGTDAPISKRQSQKRREQQVAQDGNKPSGTGSPVAQNDGNKKVG